MNTPVPTAPDWRTQRGKGMVAIAVATGLTAAVWYILVQLIPPLRESEAITARLVVALKCIAVATLFCLVGGIEAVAHERLQSPAFDPLAGYEDRRLRVNQRYLQNTLEQLVVFAVGLLGLALYSANGAAMRLVPATTAVWVLGRFAFWIGYHRSAAMRGAGAPSMMVGMVMLLYVGGHVAFDVGGVVGVVALLTAFGVLEAILFWKTR